MDEPSPMAGSRSMAVMAGLVPAIHVFRGRRKSWIPGSSPGMTAFRCGTVILDRRQVDPASSAEREGDPGPALRFGGDDVFEASILRGSLRSHLRMTAFMIGSPHRSLQSRSES